MSQKKKPQAKVDPAVDEKARQSMLTQLRKLLRYQGEDLRFADQAILVQSVLSTGYAELDRMLTPSFYDEHGTGGLPVGCMAEFFGPFAGGKTSLSMLLAASATQQKHFVYWVDAENSFNDQWAASQGVVVPYIIKAPNLECGEEHLEFLEKTVASGTVSLAVVDSVTGLIPKQILDANLEDEARVGAGAKMMSRSCPRLVQAARKGNCTIILINQIRQKIGVKYGNPETTPYGEAIRFYSHLRLRLSRVGSRNDRGITKDGEEIGIRSVVRLEKNRFGPPDREMIIPFYYDKSIRPHPLDQIIDLGLANKVLTSRSKKIDGNSVSTFSFPSQGLKGIPGIEELKETFLAQKDLIRELAKELADVKKIGLSLEIREYLENVDNNDPLDEA